MVVRAIGLAWFVTAAAIGSQLGDEWTFNHILAIGHMAAGTMIYIVGALVR